MAEIANDIHQFYDRLYGNPRENADIAITTFLEEFETKRQLVPDREATRMRLRDSATHIESAKEALAFNLDTTCSKARTTSERLKSLQEALADAKQSQDAAQNGTRNIKEAFQTDIEQAKEAFDQEMALRHADIVKQYVGSFVQKIDGS